MRLFCYFFYIAIVILINIHTFAFMQEELKSKIKVSGFKVNKLAEMIGVRPNYLYMCIKGLRNLAPEKQSVINEFLNKVV